MKHYGSASVTVYRL